MRIQIIIALTLVFATVHQAWSQVGSPSQTNKAKTDFIQNQDYLLQKSAEVYSSYHGDSLNGFDESYFRTEYIARGLFGKEFDYAMHMQKRYYVDSKYKIGNQAPGFDPNKNSNTLKPINPSNVINILPCVNEDFESTAPGIYSTAYAVSGWTIESGQNTSVVYPPNNQYGAGCVGNPIPSWNLGSPEFSIVTTPILGNAALNPFSINNINIPNSPLGGSNVARLQNSSPTGLMTRISTQFPVTNANTLFQFAYAGSWDGVHECCGQPAFRIDLYNCTGSLIPLPCANVSLTPSGQQCVSGVPGYSVTNGVSWMNWTLKYIDLTPYIGQCIRLVVTCADCAYTGHHGTAYFDSRCGGQFLGGTGTPGVGGVIPGAVSFCAGSNQAVIAAPFGYASYQWIAPGGPIPSPQGTAPTLTVNNPVPGSVYTVQANSAAGCQYIITNTINFSQVNIVGLGAGPSCPGGASGTATVVGNGSGTGYNYNWLNSASVTVGTSSTISGLAPGIYSIVLTGFGAAGCGSAVTTVSITTAPQSTIGIYKPYCNGQAYLSAGAGSNFHWYSNLIPIAPPQGIAPSLTVTGSNGAVYWLSYLSAQGCQDSIKFTLGLSAPGTMSVTQIPLICPGGSNGSAVVSLTPAPGAPPGQNSYSVFATSTLAPVFSASLATGPATVFPVSGMTAGTYSVSAFDGSCLYNTSFNVVALVYNYTISPVSTSLCPGNAVAAGLTFSVPPSPTQYSYSWTPSTWLAGNTQSSTIISPNVAPGTVSNVIYTVVVTPTAANCPLTKTLSITAINPLPPTIAPVPPLCNNSNAYTLNVVPGGGTFTAANASLVNVSSGVISPSFVPSFGTQTVTYAYSIYTCVASSSISFQVSQFHTSALTSSVPNLCVTNPAFNLSNIVQSTVNGVWSGTGVTQQGTSYIFNPSVLNTGVYPIQYVTSSSPDPTVCPSVTNLNVSVTKTTTPYIQPVPDFCNNKIPFTLTVTPGGGGWSGNGVSSLGVVTPTSYVNPGNFVATYTVADGPCINSNTTLLKVSRFVSANLTGPIPYLCVSNNPFNLLSITQNTTGTWSGVGVNTNNNTLNPFGLPTGFYAYTYTTPSVPNATLCSDTAMISTHVLNPPAPNITQAGPFCNNGSPVQLSVTPATGTWVSTPFLSNSGLFSPSLCPVGNNLVQYMIGTPTCNTMQTKIISIEAFVTAALSSGVPDQCNTNSPYNLQFVPQSNLGVWSGPGISGGSFNPSTVGSGVFVLHYNTQSSPSGLCPDHSTVAVHVYSLATPVISPMGPFCNSGVPKQIQVIPAGGFFGGANNSGVSSTGLFHPGSAIVGNNVINYSVTSGPCIAYAQTTISVEEFISADFAKPAGPFCRNADPVNMNSYVVNPGGIWSGPGISGSQFIPSLANEGNNNVIVYKTHSMPTATLCPDESEIRIEVRNMPTVNVSSNTYKGCAPVEVVLTFNTSNGGSGYWNFGDGSEPRSELNTTHIYTHPGTYTVTFSYKDEVGCSGQGQLPDHIVVHEVPKADFSVPSEVLISNPEVRLINQSSNLDNNKYSWKVGGLFESNEMHPIVKFDKIGRYQVSLEAVSAEQCKDEISRMIEVKNDFNIYIPSSFTPNYDGLNDVFMPVFSPYGLDSKTYELEVFDRWGHSLFYTKDVSKGWDGTVQNKGTEELKEEVYIYRIKYKDLDGNVYNKMGHVNLLR
ncbi:MAG TPA: gliding motility-associated C-terminal domain-containing protein [Bacteroidia bacterium]|nr:gliding motility-associated C-terminal domain-containing protein [Bacteroidia bacterium]